MNDIRFNVFGVKKPSDIYPLYISKKICYKSYNLLLIEENDKNHYVWFKKFNRLMNTQLKDGHKVFYCYYCLQHFPSEKIPGEHKEICLAVNGMQKVKLPENNKPTSFTNYHKQLLTPIVIYAEFE